MKLLRRMQVALLALLGSTASVRAQGWQLVWADEFNGSIGPDWVFETGTGGNGWGNNELQYYRPENAGIENNNLVITAKRENFGGMAYTSARMKTQGRKSWKYGRIEASIRMPNFTGSWPAFWMLGDNLPQVGWPACGEIDIMEHINTEGIVHGTVHWSDPGNAYASYTGNVGTNVTGYHTYAVEWDANQIRWYRDGAQFHAVNIAGGVNGTSEFHNNFFILLNFAVGGNWPGFAVDNNAFPAKMYVDWVRVYQWGNNPQPPSGAAPQFMLVNKNSGKSIDLIAGNQSNGAQINQWSYDYSGPNQRWFLQPTPNGHFKLISAVSGKAACIELDSTANGARLHAWDYNEGNTSQQWDLVDAGNSWYIIRNVRSGKALDVANWSTADNAAILQYDQHGGANQQWRLQPWGDYFIKASTGKYVCVQGGNGNNGNNVIQYQWENNPWFKWRFESSGEGRLKAASLAALGRAISVKYGSTAAGEDAHLWDYNATYNDQKLWIRPQLNGKFKFNFVHSGMTWDIPGGNGANNVPLEQYPDNGNAWQQFELERAQ